MGRRSCNLLNWTTHCKLGSSHMKLNGHNVHYWSQPFNPVIPKCILLRALSFQKLKPILVSSAIEPRRDLGKADQLLRDLEQAGSLVHVAGLLRQGVLKAACGVGP